MTQFEIFLLRLKLFAFFTHRCLFYQYIVTHRFSCFISDYEPRYDVFICYSYKDVAWVKELFAELEKRGFTCCIDFKDFVPGAPIVENISEAICYSRKTIAVLTPDSVQSNWWTHELQKALTRIRFHQVVPIVYKSCEIPLILQDRTYLDWENCHVKPYFWDQLDRALRQPND